MLSNYRCPRCGANLLLTRTKELPKGREQAFCPACAGPLMARDGDDTLGYALIDSNSGLPPVSRAAFSLRWT
jgi:ribosomal protein S27AE